MHLSSDDVRLSLSHKQGRSGARVFAELHRRFECALDERRSVVLDSTGMSPRFRVLLRVHREELFHVHLELRDVRTFEERERGRTDRPSGALPAPAFHRSKRVQFYELPDIVVATDERTPDEVYLLVTGHLQGRFI